MSPHALRLILACSVGGLLKTGAVGTDQYFDSTERDSTTMIIGWLELSAALLLSPLATRNRSRDAGCVAIIFAFGLAFGTKSRFRHESSVGVGLAMLLDGTLNAILAFFYARSHAPGKHTLLPSKVALGALVMGALLGFLTSSGQGSEEAEELW